MQYYFDRTVPLFLTTEGSFDAVPVNIDEGLAGFVIELQNIVTRMTANMAEYGSPEDSAQQLADEFLLAIENTSVIGYLDDTVASLQKALEEVEDEEDE